jgi:ABC-2 type transport system permease protein
MQALARMFAIALKEVQQMLRDKLTFAMAVGVPIMQLVLFGYAINTDPKGLPTAIVSQDTSPTTRK